MSAANPSPISGKALVRTLIEDGFGQRDPEVFHRIVANDYIQHNPLLASGRAGILAFLDVLASIPDNTFTICTMIQDGALVATHSLWHANGLDHAVVDLFRVEDGQLHEHWDAMQRIDGYSATRPAVGPLVEPSDFGATEANRALVTALAHGALVSGDWDQLAEMCADALVQHRPGVDDGARAFVEDLRVRKARYDRVHRVLVEGNLALVQAEGVEDDRPVALYHLFRLAAGQLVEHWAVVQDIPPTAAHDNGMF